MANLSYRTALFHIAAYCFLALWVVGWVWEFLNPETPAEHAKAHHVARSLTR